MEDITKLSVTLCLRGWFLSLFLQRRQARKGSYALLWLKAFVAMLPRDSSRLCVFAVNAA
jgi:hypothetical protein